MWQSVVLCLGFVVHCLGVYELWKALRGLLKNPDLTINELTTSQPKGFYPIIYRENISEELVVI
jgi:hypothetical protein